MCKFSDFFFISSSCFSGVKLSIWIRVEVFRIYLVFSSFEYEVWWRIVGDLNFLSFLYLWLIGIKFGLTQLTRRIWLIRLEIRLVRSGQLMWRFWIWFWHRQRQRQKFKSKITGPETWRSVDGLYLLCIVVVGSVILFV